MYIKKNINIIRNCVISRKARLSVNVSSSVVLNVGVNFYSCFSIVRHEDEPEPPEVSGNRGANFSDTNEKNSTNRGRPPSRHIRNRVC